MLEAHARAHLPVRLPRRRVQRLILKDQPTKAEKLAKWFARSSQGRLLHRDPEQRPRPAGPVHAGGGRHRQEARPAARGHRRRPLPVPGGRRRPRRAALHQHAARSATPDENRTRKGGCPTRTSSAAAGRHVPALPRARRTPWPAVRRSPTGWTSSSTSRSGTSRSSPRRAEDARRLPARALRAGPQERYGDNPPRGRAQAARARAGHHLPDGVRQLFPDRLGLRPLRPRERHPGHGPRFRLRGHRQLRALPQPRRPARVRPAVRAVPRPEPLGGARHRHRLLPGPAGAR